MKAKLPLLLLLCGPAGPSRAADCRPPAWTKVVDVRRGPGEVTGVGKGATADVANREARRALAQKVVPKHVAELTALPRLKGQLNRKAYGPDDITKALVLAVAFDLRSTRRLQADVVCGTSYIALAAKEKAVLDAAAADDSLARQVDLALTNEIDAAEEKRATAEAQARQKAVAEELSTPALTVERLRQGAADLDADDLIEGLLAGDLTRRATALADRLDATNRLETTGEHARAVQAIDDMALEDAKVLAAAQEVRRKNFVSGHEMLLAQAAAGDATAQFAVGYMEAQALGVRRDYADALVWLKKAASRNFGPAKALIGLLMLSGHAGKPDAAEGAKWFGSALDDGWACEAELTQCRRR